MRILSIILAFLSIFFTFGCELGISETAPPVVKLQVSVPKDRFRYVSRDYGYLLTLLKERRFADLNRELTLLQEGPSQDIAKETAAESSIVVFYRPDKSLEPLLSEWVKAMPDSYTAHLARGVYLVACGANARGSATADKTSDDQFAGMERYLAKARQDLERAVALKDDLLEGYCYLLIINRTSCNDAETNRDLINKVLKRHPLSLNARLAYLGTLMPRWGGSLEAMEQFVLESRSFYKKNPRLMLLEGRVDLERGDERRLFNNEDYAGALEYYNQALRFGDHWYYLQKRGFAHLWLEHIDDAYADFNSSLEMNPYDNYSLENRAFCIGKQPQLAQGGLNTALGDLERLVTMFPESDEYRTNRGALKYLLKDTAGALEDFEQALRLNPANARATWLKGKCLARLQQEGKGKATGGAKGDGK